VQKILWVKQGGGLEGGRGQQSMLLVVVGVGKGGLQGQDRQEAVLVREGYVVWAGAMGEQGSAWACSWA